MDFIKPLLLIKGEEQYPDTLASHNYDKESFLLLEFFSAAFSLIVIMLQTNSSLSFSLLPRVILGEKISITLVIFNIQNPIPSKCK